MMTKKTAIRLLTALLAALLLLSLAAYGSQSSTDSQPDKNSPTAQQADNQKQAANKQDEAKTEETGMNVSGSENSTKDDTQQEDNKTTSVSGSSTGTSSSGSSSSDGSSSGGSSSNGSSSSGSSSSDSSTGSSSSAGSSGGNSSSGGSTTGSSSSGGSASQPESPASKDLTCTISISCSTILNNMDLCDESVKSMVPSGGTILRATTVTFSQGETVYDVLQRVCRDKGIQMESSWSSLYNSAYVEGINNIYEFDVGDGSGWMYKVNGWFPNYGCSGYTLSQGDAICWVYTCNRGDDVGGGYAT